MNKWHVSALVAVLIISGGCTRSRGLGVPVQENKVPGTVEEPWVEPMPDQVKVPAGLDPTGTYYLPAHDEIVEIRPDGVEELDYDKKRRTK